jgi:hypothetical protein
LSGFSCLTDVVREYGLAGNNSAVSIERAKQAKRPRGSGAIEIDETRQQWLIRYGVAVCNTDINCS